MFELESDGCEDTLGKELEHREEVGFGSQVDSEPANNIPAAHVLSRAIQGETPTFLGIPLLVEAMVQTTVDFDAPPPFLDQFQWY